jgi:hypothetical protein
MDGLMRDIMIGQFAYPTAPRFTRGLNGRTTCTWQKPFPRAAALDVLN